MIWAHHEEGILEGEGVDHDAFRLELLREQGEHGQEIIDADVPGVVVIGVVRIIDLEGLGRKSQRQEQEQEQRGLAHAVKYRPAVRIVRHD